MVRDCPCCSCGGGVNESMTASELIAELSKLDPDEEIYIQVTDMGSDELNLFNIIYTETIEDITAIVAGSSIS